jgi:8-oxo-dGTP pyrophosphatase MutT (NUDIX family)
MEQGQILPAGRPAGRTLTRRFVEQRFASHPAGRRGSPGVEVGRRGDHSLNPGMAPPDRRLTPAAVLVPLVLRDGELSVLLTQRTAHLTDHAGQIAFPGGRIEPEDPDPVHAALREAHEEVGLPPAHVEVVGRLDTYVTGTGFEITPVVGFVPAPYPMAIDPFEVADAFEVPLSFIVDANNHRKEQRERNGVMRTFFVLPYEQRYIWGATAGMLVNLAEVLS